jgi:hypothetical protein
VAIKIITVMTASWLALNKSFLHTIPSVHWQLQRGYFSIHAYQYFQEDYPVVIPPKILCSEFYFHYNFQPREVRSIRSIVREGTGDAQQNLPQCPWPRLPTLNGALG